MKRAAARATRDSRIRRSAPARPSPKASEDWYRWIALVVGALPFTAVVFAVGRFIYTSSYRQFGLTPEDVGLTQTRIVVQAAGATGVIVALLVSLGLVARAQSLLIRSTEAQYRRSPAVPAKAAALQALVALGPLFAAVLVPLPMARGWERSAVQLAVFSVGAGVWVSGALGWKVSGFVFGVGLMAVIGGATYVHGFMASGDPRPFAWFAFLCLGYLIPQLDDSPRLARLGIHVIRSTFVLLALWTATFANDLVRAWLTGAVVVLALTWWWSAAVGSDAPRWLDRRLPGWRVIATFVLSGVVLVLAVNWVAEQESSGIDRARDIRQGANPASSFVFPIDSVPVRLTPLTDDPLGICKKALVARLLGRDGDTAFVLLRPPGQGRVDESFVVPLKDADYTVRRGFTEAGLCEPL